MLTNQMSVAEIKRIRTELGLTLREALHCFNKYGSADKAIEELKKPEVRSALDQAADAAIAKRRRDEATWYVAYDLFRAMHTVTHPLETPTTEMLRDRLERLIDAKVKERTL